MTLRALFVSSSTFLSFRAGMYLIQSRVPGTESSTEQELSAHPLSEGVGRPGEVPPGISPC